MNWYHLTDEFGNGWFFNESSIQTIKIVGDVCELQLVGLMYAIPISHAQRDRITGRFTELDG